MNYRAVYYMNNPDFIRFTPEQRASYYDERKSLYDHVMQSGTVSMNILFPERLVEYTPRQILDFPLTESTIRAFRDTMNFLGVHILSLPQSLRGLPLYLRQNGEPFILIQEYRRRLNNDDLFRALFIKTFQIKNEIARRIVALRREYEASNDHEESEYSDSETEEDDEEDDDDEDDEEEDEEEEEDTEYKMPATLQSREIPKYSKPIHIEDSHMGFDPIEGEKPVKAHIEESPDNIVFIIVTKDAGNSYFLSSKEQLLQLIKNKSNIQYVCKKYGPHMIAVYRDDVHYDNPLFKLSSTGIPTPYVYLAEIKKILESPYQVYIIGNKPVKRPIALASDDMLTARDVTSGIHCQHKKGDVRYSVYSLSYVHGDEDTMVESDEDTIVESDNDSDAPPAKRMRAGKKKKTFAKRKTKKTKRVTKKQRRGRKQNTGR